MPFRWGIAARVFGPKFGLTGWPACLLLPSTAAAFNIPAGVTDVSQRVQQLHHMSFTVCVVVGLIVFGLMGYSLVAHRQSRRPKPAAFHESVPLEIAWTVVPTLIVIGMALPATLTLLTVDDSSDADMTVVVTGSQWRWHYRYVEADIGFFSNMATPRAQIANAEAKSELYLREVDNHLVLPVGRKVRFLLTSDDVIHSWWVPEFAVKKDAIPGFINSTWTRVNEPGIYRGQCAELCGMDHAFMPIVVEVIPEADFDAWLSDQRQAMALASEAAVAAREREWSMEELLPMGEEVYVSHCATCHQPDGSGQGIRYPALAGSPITTGDVAQHLEVVMNGVADTEMQAWDRQLTDLELAAVITYERNAWGNATGDVVQPMTVFLTR
jgi:cytochrome c oxidase subunit II